MCTYFDFSVDNPISSSEFDEVYALMKDAFPKEERRTFNGQKNLLENPYYHLLTRKDDNKITAFFAYWALPHILFGEHFTVSDSLRNQGVGGVILDKLKAISEKPFIIEVEPPESEITKRRIAFYQRHNLFLNHYEYFLPPQQKGCSAVPLLIMSSEKKLTEKEFLLAEYELYHFVYKVR